MLRSFSAAFILAFTLISCTKDKPVVLGSAVQESSALSDTPVKRVPRTFLALGDSYTIGQSVAVAERFPLQTVKSLTAQGTVFSTPEIIARTGWTTANLLSNLIYIAPMKPQYDVVTLLIGVNNQYQHKTQQEYSTHFQTLLDKSIKYAGNIRRRVIVLSIPDYSVTPFAKGKNKDLIAKQIDSFNVINKTLSIKAGVSYLDIAGFSRLAATNPSLIAADSLHPSGLEYKVWADALVPVVKKALQYF